VVCRGIRLRDALLKEPVGELPPWSETFAEDRGWEIQSSEGKDSGDPMSIFPCSFFVPSGLHYRLVDSRITPWL
jgi:hypothetical protein